MRRSRKQLEATIRRWRALIETRSELARGYGRLAQSQEHPAEAQFRRILGDLSGIQAMVLEVGSLVLEELLEARADREHGSNGKANHEEG